MGRCDLFKKGQCDAFKDSEASPAVYRKFPSSGGAYVDSTARYACIENHMIASGDEVRTCLPGGVWSGKPLECVERTKCREALPFEERYNTRRSGLYDYEPAAGVCKMRTLENHASCSANLGTSGDPETTSAPAVQMAGKASRLYAKKILGDFARCRQ